MAGAQGVSDHHLRLCLHLHHHPRVEVGSATDLLLLLLRLRTQGEDGSAVVNLMQFLLLRLQVAGSAVANLMLLRNHRLHRRVDGVSLVTRLLRVPHQRLNRNRIGRGLLVVIHLVLDPILLPLVEMGGDRLQLLYQRVALHGVKHPLLLLLYQLYQRVDLPGVKHNLHLRPHPHHRILDRLRGVNKRLRDRVDRPLGREVQGKDKMVVVIGVRMVVSLDLLYLLLLLLGSRLLLFSGLVRRGRMGGRRLGRGVDRFRDVGIFGAEFISY